MGWKYIHIITKDVALKSLNFKIYVKPGTFSWFYVYGSPDSYLNNVVIAASTIIAVYARTGTIRTFSRLDYAGFHDINKHTGCTHMSRMCLQGKMIYPACKSSVS
jgi:hypothetical protein